MDTGSRAEGAWPTSNASVAASLSRRPNSGVAVLRAVTLGLAFDVLIAGCAIFTEPPPAGTRPFQAQVQSRLAGPAELTISTPAGVLPGAVRPASLPAGSTTAVTFHVPMAGEWAIEVNGLPAFGSAEINRNMAVCEMTRLELLEEGFGADCFAGP